MNGGMGKSYYSTICQENLKYNFLMLYLGNAMYCMSGNLKHQIKTVRRFTSWWAIHDATNGS
jgi:hypothetical protein